MSSITNSIRKFTSILFIFVCDCQALETVCHIRQVVGCGWIKQLRSGKKDKQIISIAPLEAAVKEVWHHVHVQRAVPCHRKRSEAQKHLLRKGFDETFIREQESIHEGSAIDGDDDVDTSDRAGTDNLIKSLIRGAIHGEINEEQPNERAKKFFQLLQEASCFQAAWKLPRCLSLSKFLNLCARLVVVMLAWSLYLSCSCLFFLKGTVSQTVWKKYARLLEILV